jgi:hypothetical protein
MIFERLIYAKFVINRERGIAGGTARNTKNPVGDAHKTKDLQHFNCIAQMQFVKV